jgi:non-lysosomal glucosylceramidase
MPAHAMGTRSGSSRTPGPLPTYNGNVMTWTPLRTHSGANRRAISLPVGGIGTGTVGFGGRGQLRDWELENHPAKGLRCEGTFLACRVQEDGRPPDAFLLEGELFDDEIEGALGSPVPVSGLKRLEEACFEATYPFGRVRLRDGHVPLLCSVEAWNPLVPGDAEASGLPIAALDITLTSTSARPIDASIMLSFEALVGHRLRERRDGGGSLPFIEAATGEEMATLLAGDRGLDERDEEWGTLAAAVLGPQTYGGAQWRIGRWNQGLTAMWETFLARGEPGDGLFHSAPGEALSGCLGAHRHLTPLSSATVRFVVGWHFPNRRAWIWGGPGPRGGSGPEVVGNHYCVSRRDALDAVRQAIPRLLDLRARTEAFVASVTGSDLAAAVKEAALSNLSTLRTQTFFRTADGRPYGWEGCLDDAGSCLGSCTHVWNYEYATAYLFPDLAREMRRIEFQFSTSDAGAMSFRTLLPLEERAQAFGLAAADGQFGRLISLYREWRSSGDDGFLRDLWPAGARWRSRGCPGAGTPTRMASPRAASTTRWMSSTTVRPRSFRVGTWARSAPWRRWHAGAATVRSPKPASACRGEARPGPTLTSSMAATTSRRSARHMISHPFDRRSGTPRWARNSCTIPSSRSGTAAR